MSTTKIEPLGTNLTAEVLRIFMLKRSDPDPTKGFGTERIRPDLQHSPTVHTTFIGGDKGG